MERDERVGDPVDQGSNHRGRSWGADELEAAWEHSLDAATDAVDASRRARTLTSSELRTESEHIREERKWLTGIRGALRRLIPRRDRGRAEPRS